MDRLRHLLVGPHMTGAAMLSSYERGLRRRTRLMALFKCEAAILFKRSEKINEEEILLHASGHTGNVVSGSCSSEAADDDVHPVPPPSVHFKQAKWGSSVDKLWAAEGQRALRGSPGSRMEVRDSRRADFWDGWPENDFSSPRLPSVSPQSLASTFRGPQLEQLWENVSHKHFHPIAHMWTHFSQLRCSFLSSSPPVGVQGQFSTAALRFFGEVMDKTRRGRLGLTLEIN